MNRAERRRRAKEDEKLLVRGIDPRSQDAGPTAAMARQLYELIERAKRETNVDPAVQYLHSRVDATLGGLKTIPIACKKGCSHCCHVWVSATALEVLFIAKRLRRTGAHSTMQRVDAAHAHTGKFDADTRAAQPYPCPMLEDDACSIYEIRPRACRFAASANATACERLYRSLMVVDVPIPNLHILGRNAYSLALAIALKHARLPYRSYEFNAALARALQREDAERAWLSGDRVFEDIQRDPSDVFTDGPAQFIYERAFG
jgi:Putative zinc- or iron-chelating domain